MKSNHRQPSESDRTNATEQQKRPQDVSSTPSATHLPSIRLATAGRQCRFVNGACGQKFNISQQEYSQ